MEYRYFNVLCEGQTEEGFVKRILSPYLENYNTFLKPVTLGGVSKYSIIRKELEKLIKNQAYYLTTILDYYKIPKDTPGLKNCKKTSNIEVIADHIENAIKEDFKSVIGSERLYPNLMMHEFEAVLFSKVECFICCEGMTDKMIKQLKDIRQKFETPEYINNSEQTAPSKRIINVYSEYQKVVDGIVIAEAIGIENMIKECPHFANWINILKGKNN